MGVLSCSRNSCGSIMCDRLSHKYGYICNECFEELINKGVNTDIKEFMDSEKLDYNRRNATEAFFNQIFPMVQ